MTSLSTNDRIYNFDKRQFIYIDVETRQYASPMCLLERQVETSRLNLSTDVIYFNIKREQLDKGRTSM